MTDQLSLLPLDMRYEIVARADISDWEGLFPFLDSSVDIGRIALLAERTIEDIFTEAVAAGSAFAVRQVIENTDLDPSLDNNWAIRHASEYGFTDVVEVLLEDNRIDPMAVDNYALDQAARVGHVEVVRLLLEDERVDPSFPNQEPLFTAVGNGNLEIVSLLLADPRVDPAVENNGPLQFAVDQGNTEVVRLLLQDPRVTPSQQNLDIAIANDYDDVIRVLLEDGRIDPSIELNSALAEAVERNNTNAAFELLRDQRVLNTIIPSNILHSAAGKGSAGLVRIMLSSQEFNSTDIEQAALEAIRSGDMETIMEFRNYI